MINIRCPNKRFFVAKMLARKIAPKMFNLFKHFLSKFKKIGSKVFEKNFHPNCFYLFIFHRGGWGWESKKYLAWPNRGACIEMRFSF